MTDYSELVKALRHCSNDGLVNCNECKYRGKEWFFRCEEEMMADAADAIEALQAETVRLWPKRGNWINSKERMRPDMCSVCGCVYEADRFMDKIAWNYCPNCGAKMFASDTNVLNKNDTMDGPIITPCRGCSDYDGYGGCKSKGGCARAKMEVQDGK